MKRILVATDGSPAAMEAVSVGVELATEHGSEVMFVRSYLGMAVPNP